MEKLIPALIYKTEDDSYAYEVFQFDRDVQVRNLYLPPKYSTVDKIIQEQSAKEVEKDGPKKIISSMDLKPKFDIKYNSVEIKIMNQPFKRIFYKNSVEIYRRHEAEKLPYIKIIESGDNELNQVTWKSSVHFEI